MQIHSNAKTSPCIRAELRRSSSSCRELASRYRVSPSTVHVWKKRDSVADRSSRPLRTRAGISADAASVALELRGRGYTLDACLDGVRQLFPEVKRASLHRLFVRQGLGNLRAMIRERPRKFKRYKPGYIHIDTFNLPRIDGRRRYCMLAVDRATRLFCLGVYDRRSMASSSSFLSRALAFFPFKVLYVLTDNGTEYTNCFYRGGAVAEHAFDEVCRKNGAEHRLTRVRTPKTNGMAERMVKMTKEKAIRVTLFPSPAAMVEALNSWVVHYNLYRKHGSLGHAPIEEARKWYKLEPELFTRSPETLLQAFGTY